MIGTFRGKKFSFHIKSKPPKRDLKGGRNFLENFFPLLNPSGTQQVFNKSLNLFISRS
ncbi:MAG: hypothetical protein ACI9XO_001832 [Paraglaciecola sp.]|jgi:hypothetical protein